MNTIETVTSYLPILDEQYRKGVLTAILDTPSAFIRYTKNAKKFMIAKITTDALANYSRNSGFVNGDVDLTWEEKTFTIDRGRALQVDSLDDLESFGMAFGRLAGVFQRQSVFPEIDAIRFAKYYAAAGIKQVVTLTAANILSTIDDLDAEMDDAEVPEEGRVLFISAKDYKLLINAENITKYLTVDGEMSKAMNKTIYSYNGHPIIKVPSGRFYSAITLKDGTTTGQEKGGYAAADGSKALELILISPTAIIQLSKRAISRFWAPTRAEADANMADGVNPNADAWKFDYRNYHDVWALDEKVKGIAVVAAA